MHNCAISYAGAYRHESNRHLSKVYNGYVYLISHYMFYLKSSYLNHGWKKKQIYSISNKFTSNLKYTIVYVWSHILLCGKITNIPVEYLDWNIKNQI